MKFLFILLVLVSCGNPHKSSKHSAPAPELTSVKNSWLNNSSTGFFASLDFTQLTLGTEQPSNDVFLCDGALGNSGQVNGVNEASILSVGTEQSGTIQFGHMEYVGASNYAKCRALSKESYTYEITGNTMKFCNVNCLNGTYPSCSANPCEFFTKQ
jgi:hypothetical protein